MTVVTKAIIPAAGIGSRMYPFTKAESKLMIPLITQPIAEYLIEELAASGIKEVIIVSNYTAELKKFFEENERLTKLLKKLKKRRLIEQIHHIEHLCKIDLMRESRPLGWIHEVLHAKKHVEEEPFVVCFSDVLYASKVPAAKQVIDKFKETNKNIRATARFLFKPSIFKILEKERFELGKDEADLDVFERLRERNDLFDLNVEGEFHNVGDPLSYLKTQTVFGLENKKFGGEYRKFLEGLVKETEGGG